jgi:hypothetical protein
MSAALQQRLSNSTASGDPVKVSTSWPLTMRWCARPPTRSTISYPVLQRSRSSSLLVKRRRHAASSEERDNERVGVLFAEVAGSNAGVGRSERLGAGLFACVEGVGALPLLSGDEWKSGISAATRSANVRPTSTHVNLLSHRSLLSPCCSPTAWFVTSTSSRSSDSCPLMSAMYSARFLRGTLAGSCCGGDGKLGSTGIRSG